MDSFERTLLALWQEAGRHADAAGSIPVLGECLARAIPLIGLTVQERRREATDFIVLADWHPGGAARVRPAGLVWTALRFPALERWAAERVLAERPPGGLWAGALRELDAGPAPAHELAGPLFAGDNLIGCAVFRTERGVSDPERVMLRAALDPLAAVVANDSRLRELGRLSARTEAERDSLLSRLGRATLNENVVGADAGLSRVMTRVDQVARTDASVLILGETGSGKEVIARAIHDRSARRNGPFIRVNCGAVAPELIDSELFGHEKGSFTGAMATRRGWFERASGGTLFLDEIGELSPAVQVRLLRVLQDGLVQRLGSETEQAVDVRVIAATHRDLPQMVQDREFREDLWYRIAVFPIILPPLRERPEDLPALALHFIQRAANRAGIHAPRMSEGDIARLKAYDWPGNVRELGAVIERAVILGQGDKLALDAALGPASGMPPRAPQVPAIAAQSPAEASSGGAVETLETVVDNHIRNVVAQCGGRLDGPFGAARLLGLNVNTLRSKMRKLGIRRTALRPPGD